MRNVCHGRYAYVWACLKVWESIPYNLLLKYLETKNLFS